MRAGGMDPSRTSRKKKSPRPKTKKQQASGSSSHTQSQSHQQSSASQQQQQQPEDVTAGLVVNIGGAQVHVVSTDADPYDGQRRPEEAILPAEESAAVDITAEEGSAEAKPSEPGKTKSSEAEPRTYYNNDTVDVNPNQMDTNENDNGDKELTESYGLIRSSPQKEDLNVTSPDEGLEISRTVIATTPCEENLRTVVDIQRGFQNITDREDAEGKQTSGSLAQIPEDLASSTQSIPEEV